jgi:hypothetical protein
MPQQTFLITKSGCLWKTLLKAQAAYDAQHNFLSTDAGLDWIKTTGLVLPPAHGTLNGQAGYFSVEGFLYDNVSGATPQSKIDTAFESTASHDYGVIDNGGTILGKL